MDRFKETLIDIDSGKFTIDQLVSILLLIVSKININSISGMARSEKELGEGATTPRGVRISGNYRKEYIGDQLICIKGSTIDNFPF